MCVYIMFLYLYLYIYTIIHCTYNEHLYKCTNHTYININTFRYLDILYVHNTNTNRWYTVIIKTWTVAIQPWAKSDNSIKHGSAPMTFLMKVPTSKKCRGHFIWLVLPAQHVDAAASHMARCAVLNTLRGRSHIAWMWRTACAAAPGVWFWRRWEVPVSPVEIKRNHTMSRGVQWCIQFVSLGNQLYCFSIGISTSRIRGVWALYAQKKLWLHPWPIPSKYQAICARSLPAVRHRCIILKHGFRWTNSMIEVPKSQTIVNLPRP